MTTSDTRKSNAHRLRRIAAWFGASVLALAVLAVILLALPSVRGRILRETIVRADAALPGTLVVGRASWPSPGTIDLADVAWIDEGDTLALAARLHVEVHLRPLMRRDVDIETVELTRARADIPAIMARLPQRPDSTRTASGEPGGFPREGAIAGVPSIAVRNLAITADSIRVGAGDVLAGIDLAASADLRHGHQPSARIERLAVHGHARAWGIDGMGVDIDLARGAVDGRVHGHAGRHWPFFVALSSDEPDRYRIDVSTHDGGSPPSDVGARISLDVERDGMQVNRIRIAADVRTPGIEELSADPALADALASAPPLEGIVAHIAATVETTPTLTVEGTATLDDNTWLDGARVAASYRDGILDVADATIALDGLDLRAHARARRDSLTVAASIDVSDGMWLEHLSPGSRLPAGFTGRADITVGGALPLEGMNAAIIATTMGYHGGVTVEITRGDDTAVRLSPIRIQARPVARAPGLDGGAGTVRIARDGAIRAQGVRIAGDFGSSVVDATIDRRGRGNATVAARWRDLPAPLVEALGLDPGPADSLRARWKQHGPFSANIRADIADDIRARVTVDLPGPRTLTPLLPPDARVDDLGNITGTIDVHIGAGPGRPVDVTADLGSTAWIDTAMIRAEITGGRARVDTVEIAIAAIRVGAAGTASADSLRLGARVVLGDADFIRRFAPGVPDIELEFDVISAGATTAPDISAGLSGVIAGNDIAGRARVGSAGVDIRLHAPDGLTVARARFDIAEITLAGRNPGSRLFPVRATINLSGDELSIYHAASIDNAHGFALAGDTLGIVIGGRGLHTSHPFSLRVGPEPGVIVIDGLDMTGTLGRLALDANLSADSATVTADVSVQMPEKPGSLALPDNYWPASARARLRAATDGRMSADVHIGGIMLADGRRPDVNIGFESTAGEIIVLAAVTDKDTVLLDGRGRLPAAVSLTPPSFHTGAGVADIEIHARNVPLALRMDDADDGRIMQVSGDARLYGTMSAPAGTLTVAVEFPGWPKLSGYRASFESTVNAGTGDDAVDARLRLSKAGAERMGASIQYSGALSLAPPFLPEDGSGRLGIHAHSEKLALDEFDALLPPDVGMSGAIQFQLDADGPPRNPSLNGKVDATNVEVTIKRNIRLLSNGSIALSGDVAEPVARGNVTIESGLIQVPEPPKELHPVSGVALLQAQREAATDSATVSAPESEKPPVRGDIDITITIPGALWIRGQGLEVELAGNLRLHHQGERPVLTGDLRAVRGSLVLLGRSFLLERGAVVFYGDDDINPSLDVQLATTIDGVTVTVSVTGTAAEPEYELRSSPEMEEGDIMSYLVFGRPLDNLDQDQKSLVETRATEIAAAMGAARLQDQLREQLGVDMVTIRGAGASDEASALVVGKYLNPRLLVKYERLLEEQAAQFINIEYFLTRHLKIDTLYGRHDQQGIEIEWSNEY